METSASIEIARHTLLSCGLVLAVGTLAALLAQKIRIPDVAVFLIVGIAIGPQALGLIDIRADSALNQIILLFGASYILFDGGASLRFDVLRQVWITIVVIATVGVIITALITVCATRSRIRTCRKIGTSVAGSVEASVAPNSSATIGGMPKI